jgi:hypothetical protein
VDFGGASALSTMALFGCGAVKVGSLVWLRQRWGKWGKWRSHNIVGDGEKGWGGELTIKRAMEPKCNRRLQHEKIVAPGHIENSKFFLA